MGYGGAPTPAHHAAMYQAGRRTRISTSTPSGRCERASMVKAGEELRIVSEGERGSLHVAASAASLGYNAGD